VAAGGLNILACFRFHLRMAPLAYLCFHLRILPSRLGCAWRALRGVVAARAAIAPFLANTIRTRWCGA